MKKKRSSKTPKLRHVWAINPKTRVKPSQKRYERKDWKRSRLSQEEEII